MKKKTLSPKERLLEAGTRLFAKKGYASTSVNEIVAAAGLAKPALYYYFKNKEELYLSILSYGFDERLRLMKEAFENHDGWKNQLVALVCSILKFSKDKRDLCRVTFHASFSTEEEASHRLPMRKMAARNADSMITFFKRGIQEGFFKKHISPQTLALAFKGQILMYVLLQSLDSPMLPKNVRAEKIVELFLEGSKK